MEPKVTLLTWTNRPLETIYSVWAASKNEEKLMTPEEIESTVPKDEVVDLFKRVVAQRIPVGEHINFVFMIEGVSVSWREQAVRHRIGTLPSPERLGVDMVVDVVPNAHTSSYWSQSMRLADMGKFYDKMMFRVPDSLIGKSVPGDQGGPYRSYDATHLYHKAMSNIQDAYNALVAAGVPMEDARELIPLGAQHRISWSLNMGSLQHIVGERGCWILQLGIWGPVIEGMIKELAQKVHPVFSELVRPPCLEEVGVGSFTGCVYKEECNRRLDGTDKLPPCPLHLNYHHLVGGVEKSDMTKVPMVEEMKARAEEYREFWGRNPYTGKVEK